MSVLSLVEYLSLPWRHAWCATFHPRWYEIERVSDYSQHIGCRSCKCEWAVNHDVRVCLPWDSDFAAFYEDLKRSV